MPLEPPPESRVPALSRAELRELDRRASAELSIPTIVLMENAAIGLVEESVRLASEHGRDHFLVVCGAGNNGGDGFAAARHLHVRGLQTRIVYPFQHAPKTPDARTNADASGAMGIPGSLPSGADTAGVVDACDAPRTIIIDALLGTGLTDPPRPDAAAVIEAINRSRGRGALVVSADIPSGLDADTGAAPGACVRSDATVTFAAPKLGFANPDAQSETGQVVLKRIGIPDAVAASLARERG